MVDQNVTGLWRGRFSYPTSRRATGFTATLIETGDRISGGTNEIWQLGDRAGETVLATISGYRDGHRVRFTKAYEGPTRPNHSVEYEGVLSDDFLEIEGRWFIPTKWAGRFLMIRADRRPVEAERSVFEQV